VKCRLLFFQFSLCVLFTKLKQIFFTVSLHSYDSCAIAAADASVTSTGAGQVRTVAHAQNNIQADASVDTDHLLPSDD
jgi:hypothetical protein